MLGYGRVERAARQQQVAMVPICWPLSPSLNQGFAPMTNPIPEGWTAHDGKGCPVDEDTIVRVIFRDGFKPLDNEVRAAVWNGCGKFWKWTDQSPSTDIIAYQEVKQ
jgi:hypothetical protein